MQIIAEHGRTSFVGICFMKVSAKIPPRQRDMPLQTRFRSAKDVADTKLACQNPASSLSADVFQRSEAAYPSAGAVFLAERLL